jgi:hypothetical protein
MLSTSVHIICVHPDQPSTEQLCISIPMKSLSVCGLNFMFNACFDTLWSIGDCLVLWTGHVAPPPAPPQALYLAGCNQITCVFTWAINPYLMLCSDQPSAEQLVKIILCGFHSLHHAS